MTTGVLLIHHGTVSNLEDIPAFLKNIRRGRPAPPELVAEMVHRYEVIGGSPLMRDSEDLASTLSERLVMPVGVAGRLWNPYPSEVLSGLRDRGVRRVVSLPLAPQSVDVYHASVVEAATALGLEVVRTAPWGRAPKLVEAFRQTVEIGLARLEAPPGARRGVVLSAHSLPTRVIASGDRYEIEFREMAELVAAAVRTTEVEVEVAFQSQGASAEPWLGPDLPATFQALVARGIRHAIVAPIGFVAEHVETLYDLDVEAVKLAKDAGLERYARAPAVSTRPSFVDVLAEVARGATKQVDSV